jgi:hypothetical protein
MVQTSVRAGAVSFVLAMATWAEAIPMGHGTSVSEVQGDLMNNQGCAYFQFANQTYDVFGVDVNLGTDLGDGIVCLNSTVNGVAQPSDCASTPDDTIFMVSAQTAPVCGNPPMCTQSSFVTVGDSNPTGTLADAIGSDVAITADGQASGVGPFPGTSIPGCPLVGGVYRLAGTISVNAFQKQATSVGMDQTVTFPQTTYFNPLTGTEYPVDVELTFANVTGAGTTTVTATSNYPAAKPANFAFSYNGFHAAFLEISTTATIVPPIEICTSYVDVDDDGFLDGTAPPVPEDALSLLHGEGEDTEFVDRTSSRDADNNIICGMVDHLSPFAVMVRTTGICETENDPCDDGDACTVTDTCNASLDCVGTGAPSCDDENPCTLDTCESPAGCAHAPVVATSCNISNSLAKLQIRDSADDSKDQVKFQWKKGTTPLSDFGAPTVANDYTFCVFDEDGVVASGLAPAGATCGADPCWTTSDKGVKYTDKSKPPVTGVAQVSGTASTVGKSSVQLKLTGETVPAIDIGAVAYPVLVQLQTADGECWEQTFTLTDEKKNDGIQLKLGHKVP